MHFECGERGVGFSTKLAGKITLNLIGAVKLLMLCKS